MSGDGFGDTLSAYEAWLHHRAHQMVQGTQLRPNGDDHDDLVQRGLVAMWQATDSFDPDKGALPSWLTMKADGAMKDSLRPRAKHIPVDSLDELLDTSSHNRPGGGDNADAVTPEALLEYPDMLQGLVRAYHRGEVARALDTLTPKQREYVRLRFWEGLGTKELTARFGYDPSGLWNSKKNGARIKLQKALAHLG